MTAGITAVQCPILVGRDDILDLADKALADAAAGRGLTLLFAGEAGIGKTRLVQSIVRRARASGFRASGGDLAPQDADVPLAALRDLFRTMWQEPTLKDLGDELLARCDDAAANGDAYSRTLVLDLVDRIRRRIDRPTLLRFEDLQWADDMTLEAIADLARFGEDLPLLIVAVYRRDEMPPGTPLRDWRSRLLTQRHAEEVRLDRLSLEDTATVATLLLGTGLPASTEVVRAVFERSDGLPLHIEELIAAARGTDRAVDAAAIRAADVPDTIEDAIRARVAHRSRDAQAVARAGAVMPSPAASAAPTSAASVTPSARRSAQPSPRVDVVGAFRSKMAGTRSFEATIVGAVTFGGSSSVPVAGTLQVAGADSHQVISFMTIGPRTPRASRPSRTPSRSGGASSSRSRPRNGKLIRSGGANG